MAGSSSTVPAVVTIEEENFFRIQRLLDVSNKTLQRYLAKYFTVNDPGQFYEELKTIKSQLKLYNSQEKILFPKNKETKIEKCDITLILALLRTSKCTPSQADLADIKSIQKCRNKYAHSDSYAIPTAQFQNEWTNLTSVLERLGADPHIIKILKTQTLDSSAYKKIADLKGKRSNVWYQVPMPVKEFHARVNEIDNIHSALLDTTKRGCVISNHGGVGKTQLAIKYCSQYSNDYNGNVIWINSDTRTNIESSFQSVADYIDLIPSTAHDAKNIASRVYDFFADRPCLFVFDDANDVKLLNEYLPKLPPSSHEPVMLVTSQSSEWGSQFAIVPLHPFTDAEAQDFVTTFLHLPASSVEDVKFLCKELGNLPLALHQAVCYIKKHGIFLNMYNKMLQEGKYHILKEEVPGGLYTKTCLKTFDLAREKLHDNGDNNAIKLLSLMSYMDGKHINRSFLELSFSDVDTLYSALKVLSEYSLITYEKGTVQMHTLVQLVVRITTAQNMTFVDKVINWFFPSKSYYGMLLDLILECVHTQDDWVKSNLGDTSWVAHVITLCARCEEGNTSSKDRKYVSDFILRNDLIAPMCDVYESKCQYNTGYSDFNTMFENFSQISGRESSRLFNLQNCKATLLTKVGRKKEALDIFDKLVTGYTKQLGANHVYTLNMRINKLSSLIDCGHYKHAEREIKSMSEIKSFPKLREPEQISFLEHKATLSFLQGHSKKALDLFNKCEEDLLSVFGEEASRRLYTIQYSKANCLFQMGEYEKSKKMFEDAQTKALELYTDEKLEKVCIAKRSIAKCLLHLNRTDEALEILDDVLKELLEQFDEFNTEYLSAEYFKVIGLIDKNDFNSAKELVEKNIKKRSEMIGKDHPYVLLSKVQLARCLMEELQLQMARDELIIIREKQKKELHILHPNVLETEFYLGICYSKLGDTNKASMILHSVYEGQKEILGVNHPSTNKTENNTKKLFVK
ncbi:uncharacterized protein LOC130630742 [Hydractinia symbiolongicarpus]|uniref:uncharacterized protein LOC130630742 n=1 Tax=Hydractinia symbiolongicarpus TaxID=13093 RepID=UPI00254A54EE|nr:uncharacterized protein LOC130630742 [Hydractinia symbiolongicarpus]